MNLTFKIEIHLEKYMKTFKFKFKKIFSFIHKVDMTLIKFYFYII